MLWTLCAPALAGSAPWMADPRAPMPVDAIVAPDGRVRVLVRSDPARLLARGLPVHRRSNGRSLGALGWVPLTVDRSELAALAAEGHDILHDRVIDFGPPPTRVTSELVGASAVRARPGGPTGAGVRIANIDTNVEVTHPHFFRADAGIHRWLDVDGDGELTPGVDGIDLDGDGSIATREVLWRLEAWTWRFDWQSYQYVVDRHALLDPEVDWLYLDLDGDGSRTAGRPAWTDDDPGLSEPTFVPDDVDGDGRITADERLWQLGTSVVSAVWWDGQVYRRGEGLTRYDRRATGDRSHGTGVSGVMVGGQLPGQRRTVGLAPDADLLFVSYLGETTFLDLFEFTEWVGEEGADAVLHEYAPWTGTWMDGSSPLEAAANALALAGVPQVCAAGNLADAGKHARVTAAGGAFSTGLNIPPGGVDYLELEVHRQPPGNTTCSLSGPGGELPLQLPYASVDGTEVWVTRETSPRGNTRHHALLWRTSGVIAEGDWTLSCSGTGMASADVYVADFAGWDRGVVFDDEDRSRTMGSPATAEHCVAVAAYSGRWPDERVDTGGLRYWSSRGPALGGQKTIDLAAPDDPFTPSAIVSPEDAGAYSAMGGTSGAAPHVAAAAALVKAAHPDWDGAQVRERLIASADPQPGAPDGWGSGKIDVWAALDDGVRPDPPPPVDVGVRRLVVGDRELVFVDGGDEVRWDLGYDGAVDHVGASWWIPPGQVARIDVLERGWRVGGAVVIGREALEPDERRRACGCASAGPAGGWALLALLALVRRRPVSSRA